MGPKSPIINIEEKHKSQKNTMNKMKEGNDVEVSISNFFSNDPNTPFIKKFTSIKHHISSKTYYYYSTGQLIRDFENQTILSRKNGIDLGLMTPKDFILEFNFEKVLIINEEIIMENSNFFILLIDDRKDITESKYEIDFKVHSFILKNYQKEKIYWLSSIGNVKCRIQNKSDNNLKIRVFNINIEDKEIQSRDIYHFQRYYDHPRLNFKGIGFIMENFYEWNELSKESIYGRDRYFYDLLTASHKFKISFIPIEIRSLLDTHTFQYEIKIINLLNNEDIYEFNEFLEDSPECSCIYSFGLEHERELEQNDVSKNNQNYKRFAMIITEKVRDNNLYPFLDTFFHYF